MVWLLGLALAMEPVVPAGLDVPAGWVPSDVGCRRMLTCGGEGVPAPRPESVARLRPWGALGVASTAVLASSVPMATVDLAPALGLASAGSLLGWTAVIGQSTTLRRQGYAPNPLFLATGAIAGGVGLAARGGVGIGLLSYAAVSPFLQLATNALHVRRERFGPRARFFRVSRAGR